MITLDYLEARAAEFTAQIKRKEADLIATRAALELTEHYAQVLRDAHRLKCPACGQPDPVTAADFAAHPHITTVWCETCKAPSSREAWLGLPEVMINPPVVADATDPYGPACRCETCSGDNPGCPLHGAGTEPNLPRPKGKAKR